MKEVDKITTKEMLIEIIEKTDIITNKFYKQEEIEGFRLLNDFLDLVSEIMEQLINNNINEVPLLYQEIIKFLKEALQAMEVKDTILLADILQYELKERFESVLNTL